MKPVCLGCKQEFEKRAGKQKFCSVKCRNHYDYLTHKAHHKTKHDAYRKKHPERMHAYAAKKRLLHKDAIAKYFRDRHQERREWILGIKASLKCSRCGESRPICLDFHHLDGSTKEHNISTMIGKHHPKERILNEIAKCSVLCRNCHAVEHFEPLG